MEATLISVPRRWTMILQGEGGLLSEARALNKLEQAGLLSHPDPPDARINEMAELRSSSADRASVLESGSRTHTSGACQDDSRGLDCVTSGAAFWGDMVRRDRNPILVARELWEKSWLRNHPDVENVGWAERQLYEPSSPGRFDALLSNVKRRAESYGSSLYREFWLLLLTAKTSCELVSNSPPPWVVEETIPSETTETLAAPTMPPKVESTADAEDRAKYERILKAATDTAQILSPPNHTAIARYLAPPGGKKFEGLGQHTIRKVLAGTDKKAKRLGFDRLEL